jgi:hypothetical protein
VAAVTPVPASALPFDDATFGFFASACDQDATALVLMAIPSAIGFARPGWN